MADAILVVDIGSSSLRASLFNASGACLRQVTRTVAARSYDLICEVDSNELWAAMLDAIAALEAAPTQVGGIGVTTALGTLLADADGTPLSDIVSWQDRRARAEAAETIRRVGGADRLYAITGRRIAPELLAPILLWFRAHRPERFRAATVAPSVKDWLVQRLCGEWVTDPTSASYTLLYDVVAGRWSEELAQALGLTGLKLARVRGAAEVAGGLRTEVARRCGLRAGTPVVVGGPDGTVAGIGAGLIRPGVAINVMGTTDVVFAYTDRPCPDAERRLVLNRFPVGEAWTIGGPMAATGGVVPWLRNLTGATVDVLNDAARNLQPGAGGLAFLPTLAGSRAPRWEPAERGTLAGLSFDHGAPHLFRALLEGCAIEVAEMFDVFAACNVTVAEVRGVGGGTASELWLQIRASVLDRPIAVPEVVEASSLGAAMLGAVGIGLHSDLEAAASHMVRCTRQVAPVPDWVEPYRALRRRYADLRRGALPAGDG